MNVSVKPRDIQVPLNARREATARFSVANQSGDELRLRASAEPQEGAEASWFTVESPEQGLRNEATAVYRVRIHVPTSAAPGSYSLKLRVEDASDTMQHSTSPDVSFEVKPGGGNGGIPIWVWILVGLLVAAGAGTAIYLCRPDNGPPVVGMSLAEAKATLEAEHYRLADFRDFGATVTEVVRETEVRWDLPALQIVEQRRNDEEEFVIHVVYTTEPWKHLEVGPSVPDGLDWDAGRDFDADLGELVEADAEGADLRFQFRSSRATFSTFNGARVASMGNRQPTHYECVSNHRLADSGSSTVAHSPTLHLCLVTDEGRVARIKLWVNVNPPSLLFYTYAKEDDPLPEPESGEDEIDGKLLRWQQQYRRSGGRVRFVQHFSTEGGD